MENSLDFQEIVNLNLKLHYFFGNMYPKFDSASKVTEYVIRALIFAGKESEFCKISYIKSV